eukprot:TRINITY_DN4987_c0_g1_i1.p1 TRINITY_DN4987_c0_g1~~TRINITY_DN4987_c0_g1_i1.p1  ORF type:complete len:342 (+),score=65.31 TRINITY_DN4987_c0_g1_i1:1-1026(+)
MSLLPPFSSFFPLQGKLYNFIFIWLPRRFGKAVASQHKDAPSLDGGEKGHALVAGANQMYIIEELGQLPKDSVLVMDTELFNTHEGQEKIMDMLDSFLGWSVRCKECFSTWKMKTATDAPLSKYLKDVPYTMEISRLLDQAQKERMNEVHRKSITETVYMHFVTAHEGISHTAVDIVNKLLESPTVMRMRTMDCGRTDEGWLKAMISANKFPPRPEKGKTLVLSKATEASHICGWTQAQRQVVEKYTDLKKMVPTMQAMEYPVSLVKLWSAGVNPMETVYALKAIVLRDSSLEDVDLVDQGKALYLEHELSLLPEGTYLELENNEPEEEVIPKVKAFLGIK